MRRYVAGLSIRTKLTAVIVATSAAALVLAAGAFVVHEVLTYRGSLVGELTSLARVVGSNTTAALTFDDRRAAAETLAGLSGEPQILRAALYDGEGHLFAAYPAEADPVAAVAWIPLAELRSAAHRFFPSYVELAHPVVFDGEVLGTVVLRSSLEALRARLTRLVTIAVGILVLASLVAYSLSLALGRLIARPVLDLAETMGRVSREGDFSLRATGGGTDELGALVEGFNRMLAQLQARDEELLRLATAVEQAAEAIVITDKGWRIQYVNPAFERITGYPRAEAVGEHIRLLGSGENPAGLFCDLEERVADGEPWSGHLVNRRKDGSLYEEECTISPVRDDRGHIVNYVAVKRDVTAEVRLEKQLRQSQKLEALGTLAGGIAHDFNNVLTPILGYTEMAVDDLPPDSRVREGLGRVLAAAERARDLVKQILAFSRRAEQERHPLRLGDLVRETLQLVSATLPKTIAIRSTIDDGVGPVVADATQLHQVLLNLCTNAWHAMGDEGGVLEVTLDAAEGTVSAPGVPHARLTVRDTGCGMSAEVLDRIFEPFFTTKAVGEGTGLGLAAVHGIVRSHGGSVAVESEPGRGSAFQVFLPLASAAQGESRPPSGPPPRGTESILFVDDEEAIAELGRRSLESLGYRVVATTSSVKALDLFRREPQRFDAVVTDQAMPELTGANLARELLAMRPGLPIVLCTGFSRSVTLEAAKELGVRRFLPKPATLAELGRAVREALDEVASGEASAGTEAPGNG